MYLDLNLGVSEVSVRGLLPSQNGAALHRTMQNSKTDSKQQKTKKKKLRLRLTFVFVLLLFLIVSNFVWPEEGGLFAKWSTAVHIGANESHFIERILWQEPNKKM